MNGVVDLCWSAIRPQNRSHFCGSRSRRLAGFTAAALIVLTAGSSLAAVQPPAAPPAPVAAAAATGVPASATAAAPKSSILDPTNLLLLSVELDGLTLTDAMTGYGDPGDPLLPIGELTRLLELDVDVSPAEGHVIGRIGESRRSLVIDLTTHSARDGQRAIDLAADDVAAGASEIYVKASALQKLLPLKIKVDAENLNLKITASEPLPIQSRVARMARQREAGTDLSHVDKPLIVPTPYRLFSLPAYDIIVGSGIQTTKPRVPLRYDMRIGADLFYGGFQGYLGSNERGETSVARFTWERRSLEGNLLGPLKARDITVGDVYTPALPLGPRSIGGRGFEFSTRPLDQATNFNRVDLRGELPIGYDVELYVNDVLRTGQNTPTQGRYEFLNVPLSSGVNVVRIVTYGPHGERNESTRVINVGGGQLRKGEATLDFGIVQQEKSILVFPRPDETQTTGAPGYGGVRMTANVNYGLTSTITMAYGAAIVPTNTPTDLRAIWSTGLRTSLFGFATNFDLASDDRHASAASLGLAGTIRGTSLVLRHSEFRNGFIDENGPGVDLTRPMLRRTELTVDGNVKVAGDIIPVSFRTLYNGYANGQNELSASARASTTVRNFLLSSGLEFQDDYGGAQETSRRLSAYFAGSTYGFAKWQLRSTLDFEVLPTWKARALAVTADREINSFASLRLGVSETLDDLNSFSVNAATIFKMGFGDLSLTGNYNNFDKSWSAGVQLSFGLDYNPARKDYVFTRPGPGSGGSVLFEAFLDKNGNGEFDPGEQPVPGVVVEGAERKAVTGKDGKVFITGVGSNITTRLLVNLDNVENTSLQTPPSTIQISPRAGSFTVVKYPLRPTVEVLVRIMLRRDDGTRVGLSAVNIQLLRDQAEPVEARTEYDGSANFASLTPGVYRLELDPEQAQRLRMTLIKPVTIIVKGDEGFLPDVTAEVQFAPRTDDKKRVAAD
jgi:hypothetical protein